MSSVFLAEDREELGVHQVMAEAVQNGSLDLVTAQGAGIVARPLVPGRRAAGAMGVEVDNATAAHAALDEAGKQMARATAVPIGRFLLAILGFGLGVDTQFALARFNALPELLLDNPKIWNVLDDPLGFRIKARDALSGLRVLDIAQAVPHQSSDVEFVIQNACAALTVAVNGGRSPRLAGGSGHFFGVQPMGNGAR